MELKVQSAIKERKLVAVVGKNGFWLQKSGTETVYINCVTLSTTQGYVNKLSSILSNEEATPVYTGDTITITF